MTPAYVALSTGLGYLVATGFAACGVNFLRARYDKMATVGKWSLGVGIIYAVVLFFRGLTILFPGEAVKVEALSLIAPVLPWTLVVVNATILDHIMRHKAPPPLMERIVRLFLMLTGNPRLATEAAFAIPQAAVGDVPSDEPVKAEMARPHRLAVLILAALVLAGIIAIVVLSSPVAAVIEARP